jgi:hypothetical protein
VANHHLKIVLDNVLEIMVDITNKNKGNPMKVDEMTLKERGVEGHG